MKFLPLVWRNLLRRKVRTIFTVLSIFTAFVLFGVLMALRAAFSMGIELAGADRLMVLNKISLIMPLPESYGGRVRAIVTDPTLLLCDEPTGDLDRKSGDEILDLLQALNRDHGKTIVMVTHDPHAAVRAKRTLHLEKGVLVSEVAA